MARGGVVMNTTASLSKTIEQKKGYDLSEWERYAKVFSSITTPAQMEVYEEASSHLFGDVLDAGSGTGKIAHYLNNNPNIDSYTGVDSSKEMVEVGNDILQRLDQPLFKIKHCKIEDTVGVFDSAISIQSFYAWTNPKETLNSIFKLLKPDGIFILATANNELNLNTLIKDADKILSGHPNIDEYKQLNIQLADNAKGNFISLDELVCLVREVGFIILEANQRYFHGGINFLVIKKKD